MAFRKIKNTHSNTGETTFGGEQHTRHLVKDTAAGRDRDSLKLTTEITGLKLTGSHRANRDRGEEMSDSSSYLLRLHHPTQTGLLSA